MMSLYDLLRDVRDEFLSYQSELEELIEDNDLDGLQEFDADKVYSSFAKWDVLNNAVYQNFTCSEKLGCSKKELKDVYKQILCSVKRINNLSHPSVVSSLKPVPEGVYS